MYKLCLQIVARLSNEDAKAMFKAYVEREDSDSISVSEVKLAFPSSASLLEVMDRALSASSSASAHATGLAGLASEAPAVHLEYPRKPSSAQCLLPQPDALYTGTPCQGWTDLLRLQEKVASCIW